MTRINFLTGLTSGLNFCKMVSEMRTKKIMIVDDDKDFLEELKETLSLSGHETTTASNGLAALKIACKARPDVILLDLRMEGMDGFGVAKELRCSPETASIPIIAMTAFYTEEEYLRLVNVYGVRKCLKKPLNPLDVMAEIEKIAGGEENGKRESSWRNLQV